MGFEQIVSTQEAGFTGAPVYLADLVAARPSSKYSATQVADAITHAFGHITRATAESFVYRVVILEPFVTDLRENWAVSWLGVEPRAGCPPELDLKRLLTLGGHFSVAVPSVHP
jgi:hypothetical protein